MESIIHSEAWVTLATNDSYALGALVLAHSLRRVHTNRHLTVLITPDVSQGMREHLAQIFNSMNEVNVLDSNDEAHLALMQRPELGVTFTKLHCWRLTQFSKCVFLDADTLVIQNCDELFEREELSAAADIGWPDCFNSGVFVYKPSNETFMSLLEFAIQKGSFDGGDQGLLNLYFSDWATKDISKHLPFIYNMTSSAAYTYTPAFKAFGKNVKIVHFLGAIKPWMQGYDTSSGSVQQREGSCHSQEHLQYWWNIFIQEVQSRLQPDYAGLAGQLAMMTVGIRAPSATEIAEDERARQLAWESGRVDYMGRDSFENIQKKIEESLGNGQDKPAEVPAPIAEVPKTPETPAPFVESLIPSTVPAPAAEAPAPQTPQLTEPPAPQTPQPTEPPAPTPQTPQPTEAPVPPAVVPKPAEAPAPPAVVPKPAEAPAPPAVVPKPAEAAAPPTEAPKPAEATKQASPQTPKPAETPAPVAPEVPKPTTPLQQPPEPPKPAPAVQPPPTQAAAPQAEAPKAVAPPQATPPKVEGPLQAQAQAAPPRPPPPTKAPAPQPQQQKSAPQKPPPPKQGKKK